MANHTYVVWIKDKNSGAMFKASCQADNPGKAKMIFENMYDRSQIKTGPLRDD